MAYIAKTTWIVVANRVRATIFASCGQHCPMTVVDRIENACEQTASEPERSFAALLAEMLENERCKAAFDQLILIAEPKLLAALREQLKTPTRRLVKVESNKELIRPTQESLRSHLAGYASV